jgi:hypothetical protein
VSGDTNARPDVFVRDRVAGTTERVSLRPDGSQITGANSIVTDMDRSGRRVSFNTVAPLTPEDTSSIFTDVFVRDRATAQTTRLSTTVALTSPNQSAFGGWFSADGRLGLWGTTATDVAGPEPVFEFGTDHLFVSGTVRPTVTSVAPGSIGPGVATVTLHGHGLESGTAVTISGSGVTVQATCAVDDATLAVTLSVAGGAATGPRDVTVASPAAGPDGLGVVITTCGGCLQIGS